MGKTLIVYDPTTHPSIVEIKNHVDVEKNFEFQHITSDKIEKIIDKINIKKASGFDNIPAKVIKQCKPIVSNQLTSLINLSIDTSVSPDSLKKAQVTPLHKKNDPLSKTNYRPVSVFPVFSKILKRYLKHNYLIFSTQYLTLFCVHSYVDMDARLRCSDF